MRILGYCLSLLLVGSAFGQSTQPPLSDTELSIHTLVREDVFAGWRSNNMQRLARGEKNIDLLLEQRPEEKADLLAWKGGAKLYRAVLAHEAENREEFEAYFDETRKLYAEALELDGDGIGVAAVVGGSYAVFADRLPEAHQADAWTTSYENYRTIWKKQSSDVAHMPVHIRGELLAGLAQAAQRTGRDQELDEYLDKILEVLPDTAYARMAKKWQANPELAAKNNITCKTCHAPGRLTARIAENKRQ